jgi:hypothetical protein
MRRAARGWAALCASDDPVRDPNSAPPPVEQVCPDCGRPFADRTPRCPPCPRCQAQPREVHDPLPTDELALFEVAPVHRLAGHVQGPGVLGELLRRGRP